jgi:hypothetical protein
MTQYSVRNYGPQGYRWLIRGSVQISCFGLDVCECGLQADWRHSRLPVMSERSSLLDALSRRERSDPSGVYGESCGECGNFTLTRNGICLKSATCGATKDARDVIDLRIFCTTIAIRIIWIMELFQYVKKTNS